MDADVTIHIVKEGENLYKYSIILNNSDIIIPNRILHHDETTSLKKIKLNFKNLFKNCNYYKLSSGNQSDIGFNLFSLWFQDVWGDITRKCSPFNHISITIASMDSDILNLPWELMNNGDNQFFSIDSQYSIRRFPGNPGDIIQYPASLRPGPLRILFMACAPRDQNQLFYEPYIPALS